MIDAHFHIWQQADLPWLMGPMQPRIFGPYEPIRRDYPIEEYLADAAAGGITGAVYVQANWAPAARWMRCASWRNRPGARVSRSALSPMPICSWRMPARSWMRWLKSRPCVVCACSSTGMKTRFIALRPARSRAQHVLQRNVSRLANMAGASICRSLRGRWRARRNSRLLPEGDLRAPACGDAGRPFGSGHRPMARGHALLARSRMS